MAIAGTEMQCDFVWHAQRVVVEVDGWRAHRSKPAFENDRRRDQLLRLHGWQVVRFTWDDVTKDPAHVVAVVSAMVAPHCWTRNGGMGAVSRPSTDGRAVGSRGGGYAV
jgi:very-short-patch-repair endonuclease